MSHICLYIGLSESAQTLGLRQTNLWIYPGYDHDTNVHNYKDDPETQLPLTYISFPSGKEPDWEHGYPDRSTIEVISIGPMNGSANGRILHGRDEGRNT